MKYLSTFVNNDDNYQQMVDEYEQIEDKLKSLGIDFNDAEEQIFTNHVVCLIRRLNNNELIDPIEDELMNEVDSDSLNKAKEVVQDLFYKRNIELDKSEVFLIATHIQLNKMRKEGGM